MTNIHYTVVTVFYMCTFIYALTDVTDIPVYIETGYQWHRKMFLGVGAK